MAAAIRAEIEAETRCTASAGVSHNLLLARLATKQAKPNGHFCITPDQARLPACLAVCLCGVCEACTEQPTPAVEAWTWVCHLHMQALTLLCLAMSLASGWQLRCGPVSSRLPMPCTEVTGSHGSSSSSGNKIIINNDGLHA